MSKIFLGFVGLAAVVAASPAVAQPRGEYRAIGTEPFWSVTISNGRMVYDDPEGNRVTVPAPRARPMRLGRYYRTPRLSMTVLVGRECSDGMSNRVYNDTVRVTVNRRQLEGCGGAFTDEARFDGNWRIVAINDERVSGENYAMSFTEGRVSGRAGCNRFNGSFRIASTGFVAGPLAATRMACPGAAMRHEAATLRILGSRAAVTEVGEREMVLRNNAGSLRLRQVP